MGEAIQQLGWARESYVVSTKVYWGLTEGVNSRNTLNRKYLLHSIDGCLERFGLDFVDLLFCHRPDPQTPIEETVWAMSDIIDRGQALYWGTSEWSADEIRAAWEIADRHHLRKPVMEQPQYNIFERRRVEREYARLYEDIGLGLTTWSPLASGLRRASTSTGSRREPRHAAGLRVAQGHPHRRGAQRQGEGARGDRDELDCTLSQLALAWCAKNPNVSTVITGASRVEQVQENMGALDVLPKLTDDVMARIKQTAR